MRHRCHLIAILLLADALAAVVKALVLVRTVLGVAATAQPVASSLGHGEERLAYLPS